MAIASKLMLVEPVIRKWWNKLAYRKSRDKPSEVDDAWSASADELERVIKSASFWATARVMNEVGYQAEMVGRWTEGCPCHEAQRLIWHSSSSHDRRLLPKPPTCEFQSCRAPQLASGEAIFAFKKSFWLSQQNIVVHVAGLPMTDQTKLRMDWDAARARIELELSMKLAHWQQLPYILCGLGHHDDMTAMNVARTALRLYDDAPSQPAAKHNQSRRFLDPSWAGLTESEQDREPALRPLVTHLNTVGQWGLVLVSAAKVAAAAVTFCRAGRDSTDDFYVLLPIIQQLRLSSWPPVKLP